MSDKYKVGAIIRRALLQPDGSIVDSYEINFTTSGNVTSYVNVPVSEFNKENVRTLIETHVDELNAVQSL